MSTTVETYAEVRRDHKVMTPKRSVDVRITEDFPGLQLADEQFYTSGPVFITLGGDLYSKIIRNGAINCANNPVLMVNNITCHTYSQHIKHCECHVTKIAPNCYGFNGYAIFERNMDRGLRAHIFIDIMPMGSRQAIRMVDVRFSICNVLKQMSFSKFLEPLVTEFKRVTNLPKSCTFKKDIAYEVKNFTLSDKFVPRMLSLSNFYYKVEVFNRNNLIGTVEISGSGGMETV
uniref:Uncharacterized protein n=1 Tax=Musca domestica TaxID=7370 RepID=A0A1I8NKX9_MUSDO